MNRTKERAKRKWPQILTRLGLPEGTFENKGRGIPCPNCGGKDRLTWRDYNEDGHLFCNKKCGLYGDGFTVAAFLMGLDCKRDFRKVCSKIEEIINAGR